MNIKQAAEQSGVAARNIRYYEQAGLLTPARNPENEYRIYSQADVRALKLIRMPNASGNGWRPSSKSWRQPQHSARSWPPATERRQSWMWTAALSGWTPLPRRAAGLPAGCRTTGKWRLPSISGSLPLRRTPPLQPRRSLPPSCWPGRLTAARRSSSPMRA